jgi:hypothetical protein
MNTYALIWMVALALALFPPVRWLIWVLYVRRAQKVLGADPDEAETQRLKRRAGCTAAFICMVFAAIYANAQFGGAS